MWLFAGEECFFKRRVLSIENTRPKSHTTLFPVPVFQLMFHLHAVIFGNSGMPVPAPCACCTSLRVPMVPPTFFPFSFSRLFSFLSGPAPGSLLH